MLGCFFFVKFVPAQPRVIRTKGFDDSGWHSDDKGSRCRGGDKLKTIAFSLVDFFVRFNDCLCYSTVESYHQTSFQGVITVQRPV